MSVCIKRSDAHPSRPALRGSGDCPLPTGGCLTYGARQTLAVWSGPSGDQNFSTFAPPAEAMTLLRERCGAHRTLASLIRGAMTFSGRRGAHRTLARLIPIWSREHFRRFDPRTPDLAQGPPGGRAGTAAAAGPRERYMYVSFPGIQGACGQPIPRANSPRKILCNLVTGLGALRGAARAASPCGGVDEESANTCSCR